MADIFTKVTHALQNILSGRGAPELKDSRTGPAIYMQSLGQPIWPDRNFANFAKEAYMRNVIAYRCIRMIAEAISALPIIIYDGDKEIEDHPLQDLLAKPNPFEGGDDFMDRLVSFLMIAGNSYMEAVRLGTDIKELFILRPDRITIAMNHRGYPSKYVYKVQGTEVEFNIPDPGKQMDICHIKMFHPTNDFYGFSPVEAAAWSIDTHNSSSNFNKALLDNMARPSGALMYTGDKEGGSHLTDDQFQRLKKEMAESYQGSKNAGKPMLLEGDMSWIEMMTTPRDMEFVQGKNQTAREVAIAFGVPPMLLGIPGDNTYANFREANRAFYRQTVIPVSTKIYQGLSNFFSPTYGEGLNMVPNFDEIEALSEERELLWKRIGESKVLTVNEKRDAMGYEDIEGGDVVLTASSEIPLTDQGIPDPNDPNDPDADPDADPADDEDEDAAKKPKDDKKPAAKD